jgi:putative transposase
LILVKSNSCAIWHWLSPAPPRHQIYPYLLRGVKVTGVNQLWSADITYVRLLGDFVYLVAIID